MKRLLFFLMLILGWCIRVNAQQLPQYTQYIFNELLINPAVSGIENYVDIKAGYRSQWTGLQGAPVTTYFTVTAPIGHNYVDGDALQVPADGDNPIGPSFVRTYRAAEPHSGIGLTMFSDKAGPLRLTDIEATYAYHIGLTSDINLSAGVSAGITDYSLDVSDPTLDPNAVNTEIKDDPAIYSGPNTSIKPTAGAGIWAYSAEYFIGASVQQLLPETISFASSSYYNQGTTVPHFYFTGGYKFFLSDDVSLIPSVMYKVTRPAPNTIDVNAKLAFRDHFWIGASYRQDDAVAGMMGFTIDNFLSLSYSYDYTTSGLNTVSSGTHEIVIGIYLDNRGKTGPRRTF